MFEVLFFAIIFSILIGVWASNWGRSGLLWFFLALIISPLISGIILLIIGKSDAGKAAEIESTAQKAAAIEKRKSELLQD